jgi:hypothetical protein
MAYKDERDMIDEEIFLQPGESLLDELILNRPHRQLAENFDIIVPYISYLSLKAGTDYTLSRQNGLYPLYSQYYGGGKPYYIKDGMSVRQALTELDKAIARIKALILSHTDTPTDTTPYATPSGEIIIPLPDEVDYKVWPGIPESSVDWPFCKNTQLQPLVYSVGGGVGIPSSELLAFGMNIIASGNIHLTLYSSPDGGTTWTQTVITRQAYSRTIVTIGAITAFRDIGNTSYINYDPAAPKDIAEISFGHTNDDNIITNEQTYVGRIKYDLADSTWKYTGYDNDFSRWGHQDIFNASVKKSQTGKNFIAFFAASESPALSRIYKKAYVTASSLEYFVWNNITTSIFSLPETVELLHEGSSFYAVYGGDVVELNDSNHLGHIHVVFSAKETSTSLIKIYHSYSEDSGATFSNAEVLVDSAYSMASPSIEKVENAEGLTLVVSYTTSEDQSTGTENNLGTIKAIMSSDYGITWKNKITLLSPYQTTTFKSYIPEVTTAWPTSKLIYLSDGSFYCFVNNYDNSGTVANYGLAGSLVRIPLSFKK